MSDGKQEPDAASGGETHFVSPHQRPPAVPPQADESSLLNDVVAKTVHADEPITAAEMEALRNVARTHRTASFEAGTVGVALVESLLAARYREYDAKLAQWREATQQIAEAFFDAPTARDRLERLWRRLCETTS